MEKLNEYVEAQKFLETLDWDNIPDSGEPLATICEALQDIQNYKDLEEQGLLLRLPCKVGTSVYMVAQDCGGDTLDCMRGDCEGCPYLYSFVEENKFETYMCDDIGKTVFFTQAEAEQKLKEMESD